MSDSMEPRKGREVQQQQEPQYIPEEDTISLLDIISVLAKHWKLIVFSTFFAAVGIVAFSLYTLQAPPETTWNPLPNKYKPEVKVRFQQQERGSLPSLGGGDGALGSLAALVGGGADLGPSDSAFAEQLLTGKTLLDSLIDKHNLITRFGLQEAEAPREKARSILRSSLEIEYSADSGIMTVGYVSTEPEFATELLNSALESLEQRFREFTLQGLNRQIEFLESRMQEVQNQLSDTQDELIEFQREYGYVDLQQQTQITVQQIQELNKRIFQNQLQIEELQQYVNENAPQIQRLRNENEVTRRMIRQITEGYATASAQNLPQDQLPELSTRQMNLMSSIELQTAIYQQLKSQYESKKIEIANDAKKLQVVERAEVPQLKDSPSRGMICIIVTIATFFLAVFLAFIREYFDRVKQDPDEAGKLESIKDNFRPTRTRSTG